MMLLSALRQEKDSVGTFARKFQEIAQAIPWDQSALIHQFRNGLNPSLKDEMMGFNYPPTLLEMITFATRIEERLVERERERELEKRFHSSPHFSTPSFTTSQTSRTPSDIKNLTEALNDASEQKRTYVTRYLNGDCTYCGSTKHRLADCNVKRPRQEGKGSGQSQI